MNTKISRSFILLSVLAAASYSCTVRQLDEVRPVEPGTRLEITATMEDDAQTRSSVDASLNFYWNPGDQVNLFYGQTGDTPGSLFTSQNTDTAQSSTFTGTISAFTGTGNDGEMLSFWGVSPYLSSNRFDGSSVQVTLPSRQRAVAENFAENTMLMVAKSSGLSMSFKHVGSMIRIKMSRSDIKSVTFRGNDGEIMSGRVSVTMDSAGNPVWSPIEGEGITSVRLEVPDFFFPGTSYFLYFLPQTFAHGWSLTYETADGQVGTYTSNKSITFQRATASNANGLDARATFQPLYVELGANVVWATMNVGALAPEEYGDYFAWGETSPKSTYYYTTYKYGTSNRTLTKYVTDPKYGTMDSRTNLEASDDAATVNWGPDWRTPTSLEWNWLVEHCTWTQTTQNGVAGYLVTSRETGYTDNSIFLPFAGYYFDTSVRNAGTVSGYWTSSAIGSSAFVGYRANYAIADGRPMGYPVRAVRTPYVHATEITIYEDSMQVGVGLSKSVPFVVMPSTAMEPGVVWTSSDPNVAIVNGEGMVTGVAPGTATISGRLVNGLATSRNFTVEVIQSFVDMGDGIEWATCNLGAESPEEYGYFFSWGETLVRDYETRPFTWNNYRFGREGNMWGYNLDDGLVTLRPEHDAASVMLGGLCQIPTKSDWDWLRAHCTFEKEVRGDVTGMKITSTVTGGSIFLPFAGYMSDPGDGTHYYDWQNVYGEYWSSTLHVLANGSVESAYVGHVHSFAQDVFDVSSTRRCEGRPIRAIRHKAVDMGDGLKWARSNVGACSSEEYGDYFAWGETKSKDTYSWDNYKWCQGTSTTLTKYTSHSEFTAPGYGPDGQTRLNISADDAARNNWGSTWRMPSKEEFEWLEQNSIVMHAVVNHVAGVKFISRVNGNSLFFPYAGEMKGSTQSQMDVMTSVWTASRPGANFLNDDCGYVWRFNKNGNADYGISVSRRYVGRSVRAVTE